ncbi:MAG: type II toxin-antitoxin system death-on-curing family toxin [Gammaproteobacteria bacterium]
MREPTWLRASVVIALHSESIARFGGSAGIRDPSLLESALHRPRHLFDYEADATVFGLAASYCHGLIRNHPFIDGNKRIAVLAAATFLALNGYEFSPDEADIVTIITAVAAGEADESLLTQWFRDSTTPIRR